MKLNLKPGCPIVICRSAVPPEPIEPTFRLGYLCVICEKPLQIGKTGMRQIRELRAQPLCNACGGIFLEELRELASAEHVELRLSPEATAQIEKATGESILDIFPTATTEILEGED